MKKAIILDFDGTLANTAFVLQKIYNKMAKKNGWPTMSQEDYKRLRRGSLRQALSWAGVRPWQLPFLLYVGRKEFLKEAKNIKLFTGMNNLVEDLQKAGWDLFVLSQNSEKAVKQILIANKLDDNIKILKKASFLGKHLNLKSFLATHRYKKDNIWMIGDEVRDIIASKRVGIKVIAVAWGLQDKDILKQYKPDVLVDETDEIIRLLC